MEWYSQMLHSASLTLTANPLPVRSKSLPPIHLNSCAELWPGVKTFVVAHCVDLVGDSWLMIDAAADITTSGWDEGSSLFSLCQTKTVAMLLWPLVDDQLWTKSYERGLEGSPRWICYYISRVSRIPYSFERAPPKCCPNDLRFTWEHDRSTIYL